MRYVESFLENFPMNPERSYSETELAPWADAVPAQVIGFLRRVGKASSMGFFFTQLPGENDQLLEAWGIDPAKAHLFMTSAFGHLAFATDAHVFVIEPFCGACHDSDPYSAFAFLFMDMVTHYSEFESRNLATQPLESHEMWGMFPPVKLGGHFANAFGGQANAAFRKVDRNEHVLYQASLYGHKAKGTPKELRLPKARIPKPSTDAVAPSVVSTDKVGFRDPGLHYAVVSALWRAGVASAETLHATLRKFTAGYDEGWEEEHIEGAVKALRALTFTSEELKQVKELGRDLEFELAFETIIGVETGGEGDFMAVESLRGVESLPNLEKLDLAALTFDSRKPPDLAPLAQHERLRSLILGHRIPKKLTPLGAMPALRHLGVPRDLALEDKLMAVLAARKVEIERLT